MDNASNTLQEIKTRQKNAIADWPAAQFEVNVCAKMANEIYHKTGDLLIDRIKEKFDKGIEAKSLRTGNIGIIITANPENDLYFLKDEKGITEQLCSAEIIPLSRLR